MSLEFFIPIEPKAQGRPRFTARIGNGKDGKPRAFGHAYDPADSRQFKQQIIAFVKRLGLKPYDKDVPLVLRLRFLLSKPKSVKRRYPTVKPDLDNFEKGVKDALKGLAWSDDGQVCDCAKRKRYAAEGQQPGVWVQVDEIKE